ncbi:hypothetical protein AAID91_04700 [Campylobacter coli]
MGDSITLYIFLGLLGFISVFTFARTYFITLAVFIIFSIINYWMRINIKEFVKSYFLIFFVILFADIIGVFYFGYNIENPAKFTSLFLEVKQLPSEEYLVFSCLAFLFIITMEFFIITFFILPCLLQAYLFKCYSTGEKRKKLSWFIGFVCNAPILIASVYVVYENL